MTAPACPPLPAGLGRPAPLRLPASLTVWQLADAMAAIERPEGPAPGSAWYSLCGRKRSARARQALARRRGPVGRPAGGKGAAE